MKKVLAIMGSPRKMETYKIVQQFEASLKCLGDIEFKYIFLQEKHLDMCKGCLLCFSRGEEFCPLKGDDRDEIFRQMMEADGVIMAAPVYSLQVPALLKNLLDRLAYVFHRPCFFHKAFMPIVTQGVYGHKDTLKYMETVMKFWGFKVTPGIGLTTPPMPRTAKEKKQIEDTVGAAARKFYQNLTGPLSPAPKIGDLFIFRMMRGTKPMMTEIMPRDVQYFKEKGWMESDFYYPVKLGVVKKLLGRFADWQARKVVAKAAQNK